jgi:hypothetical protein
MEWLMGVERAPLPRQPHPVLNELFTFRTGNEDIRINFKFK